MSARNTIAQLCCAWALLALLPGTAPAAPDSQARVGDLTIRQGDIPRRVAGYGLVVGLDGSGDRSFGLATSGSPTVRSVINLLQRFGVEVPVQHLRLRNVAAVLVSGEISPYLHAGGRFEVQVSALGDASSLRGGTLWITPLVTDPGSPAIATAQGPLYVETDDMARSYYAFGGNSGRIPQGGVLEVEPDAPAPLASRLYLRSPDLRTASRIAQSINSGFGEGVAKAEDPGVIALTPPADRNGDLAGFLAAVDTLLVAFDGPARIIISSREGTVVAGGDVRVGPATISHHGITLQIGAPRESEPVEGLVRIDARSSVQDVAAGLQAAGAKPDEVVAIFEGLQAAGALNAQVVIR
jgi:flagellar P-ring protein FlgI